jgi:hypothetical protein
MSLYCWASILYSKSGCFQSSHWGPTIDSKLHPDTVPQRLWEWSKISASYLHQDSSSTAILLIHHYVTAYMQGSLDTERSVQTQIIPF